MTDHILSLLGKDYLNRKEAAHYCCVSESQLRKLELSYGIQPFEFMGKLVYAVADLRRAMEHERQRQRSGIEKIRGDSVLARMAALHRE